MQARLIRLSPGAYVDGLWLRTSVDPLRYKGPSPFVFGVLDTCRRSRGFHLTYHIWDRATFGQSRVVTERVRYSRTSVYEPDKLLSPISKGVRYPPTRANLSIESGSDVATLRFISVLV